MDRDCPSTFRKNVKLKTPPKAPTTQPPTTKPPTTLPPTTTTYGGSLDDFCKKEGHGNWKHPDTCFKWVQCWAGGYVLHDCPEGTIWNGKKGGIHGACDWKANVENCKDCLCHDEAQPTTTSPPTTTSWTGPATTREPFKRRGHAHCPDIKNQANLKGTKFDLDNCTPASDPLNKPKSAIESWFTEKIFNDLFFKSNLGVGPHRCLPYSYEAFVIAARYFPKFGNEYIGATSSSGFTEDQINKRDVAGFFAHKVQETGENNSWLFIEPGGAEEGDDGLDCYMKGALWTWFEGGPHTNRFHCGDNPECGNICPQQIYCDPNLHYYDLHCSDRTQGEYNGKTVNGEVCYAGRGAVQLSWNYNYGTFARWLHTIGITDDNGGIIDLLNHPNLIMTKMDPPLSILASLWFYMNPGAGVPAMHDVLIGNWHGYSGGGRQWEGSVFGPTSKIINNECGGEKFGSWWATGGPENNRIKGNSYFALTAF